VVESVDHMLYATNLFYAFFRDRQVAVGLARSYFTVRLAETAWFDMERSPN